MESVKREGVEAVVEEGVTLPLPVPPAAAAAAARDGVEMLVEREDLEEDGDTLSLPLTEGEWDS